MTVEAQLTESAAGLRPEGEGWFVVNVRDAEWATHDVFGAGCVFENRESARFSELGINIGVVQPGQPLCLYHAENGQEDFLVLGGSCRLIVNGEERPLKGVGLRSLASGNRARDCRRWVKAIDRARGGKEARHARGRATALSRL